MTLRAMYEANEYPAVVDGVPIALRHGEGCPALDAALARRGLASAAYVTAYNPHPAVLTLEANAAAQARLRERIARFEIVCAPGGWPAGAPDPRSEREPSLLVLGISPEEVLAVGRAFGQAGVVVHEAGLPTQVVMLVQSSTPAR